MGTRPLNEIIGAFGRTYLPIKGGLAREIVTLSLPLWQAVMVHL